MEPDAPNLDHIYRQRLLPIIGSKRLYTLYNLSTPTDMLEWFIALMTTAWGAWLLMCYGAHHTWWPEANLSASTNILNLTFTLIPQWVWGAWGVSVGTLHLCTHLSALRRRLLLLFVTCCFWLAVALTVGVHVWYSTGIVAYGGFALGALLAYARLYVLTGRNGRAADA